MILRTTVIFIGFLSAAALLPAADWPQEAGPFRSNYTPEGPGEVSWGDEGPDIAWRTHVGVGGSPVIVVGDRVFVQGSFAPDADLTDGIQDRDHLVLSEDAQQHDREVAHGGQLGRIADGRLIETARWDGNSKMHEVPVLASGRLYLRRWHAGDHERELGGVDPGNLIVLAVDRVEESD